MRLVADGDDGLASSLASEVLKRDCSAQVKLVLPSNLHGKRVDSCRWCSASTRGSGSDNALPYCSSKL